MNVPEYVRYVLARESELFWPVDENRWRCARDPLKARLDVEV
jgi:hypothetical protein